MTERALSLRDMAAATYVPEGVTTATALIAGTDVRTLDSALVAPGLLAPAIEQNLSLANDRYETMQEIDARIKEASEAVKRQTAGALQDVIREMHDEGYVPPAELFDDLFRLQDEGASVADMTGPRDTDAVQIEDDKLQEQKDEVIESKARVSEALEATRSWRDTALERRQEVNLAKEIGAVRQRLSRPMRYASTILCALALGGGGTGLTYSIAKASNHEAVHMTREWNHNHQRKSQKEEIPTAGLDSNQLEAVGTTTLAGLAGGALIGFMAGEGFSGRVARWRARKIVRKAEQAEA